MSRAYSQGMLSFSFQIVGWVLFVISAVAFLTGAIIARDPYAIAGSAAFLVANIFFVIALRPPQR